METFQNSPVKNLDNDKGHFSNKYDSKLSSLGVLSDRKKEPRSGRSHGDSKA